MCIIPAFGRSATVLCFLTGCSSDDVPRLVLGTTHTVEDSGLLDVLATAFRNELGSEYALSIVVAGSGEVLTMARRGDIDAVLSHSPDDEIALVAAGRAEAREAVMHNDFVLAGPLADPAGARAAPSAAGALAMIEDSGTPFVSRGDGSGTHRKELSLWASAQRVPDWSQYMQAGTGMAEALRIAAQRHAYILADRATFEVLRHQLDLDLILEGDPALFNQYSVLVMSDARNRAGARRLADWLRSAPVQQLIAAYGVDITGRALYSPELYEDARSMRR
jgi:tungstate transport system substrate-binding protein